MKQTAQNAVIKWAIGGCVAMVAPMLVIAVLVVALIAGGSGNGWVVANAPPGDPAAKPPPNAPCLCTPTPAKTPTPLPSATPLPTWPLPPTPNPGREPEPPSVPTEVPPADATATWQAYEGQRQAWQATATAGVAQWQQTVQAGYATQTALVPTATPPPPTPIGGGPYGWPVDEFCRGYDGCAPDRNGRRVVTQDYGCTLYQFENYASWCANPANAGDYRYNANGRQSGETWSRWHSGIDLDTGTGEAYWATMDGIVQYADYDPRGPNRGLGLSVTIGDQSGLFFARWGHMGALAQAVDVSSGRSLGRVWQIGDRIRPYTDGGQRIIVGYSGTSGNSTGPHLHYMVEKMGSTVPYDVDPVPYINRRSPSDPLPEDAPPYGGP